MPTSRLIGAHVSASGGIDKAIERAGAIGCNCAQIFSGSPRSWGRAELSKINTDKIDSKKRELHVSSIIIHSLYLLNLASENPELTRKSIEAVVYDLQLDALVKSGGVVVHTGSHQGHGWDNVRERVVKNMAQILEKAPAKDCHFLIENAAGQQGKIGGDLTEIRWMIDQLQDSRLGWCFDTCHAFASGYSLGKDRANITSSANGKNETLRPGSAIDEIEELNLWSDLKCIHVNDSRDPYGSGRDRHENLGEGLIPQADLVYFLNYDQLTNIPLILEVPGLNGTGPDEENINRLKAMVSH